MAKSSNPKESKQTLSDLADEVRERGGVYTVTADLVRDCTGKSRLGSKVRNDISTDLAELGIRHIPTTFPDRQWDPVRLYATGTPASDLIEAMQTFTERADSLILEVANNDNQELLESIRQLVCQPKA